MRYNRSGVVVRCGAVHSEYAAPIYQTPDAEYQERLIPFPAHARPAATSLSQRRASPNHTRPRTTESSASRTRHNASSPGEHALAAAQRAQRGSGVGAGRVLGLGFGLLQTINHPRPTRRCSANQSRRPPSPPPRRRWSAGSSASGPDPVRAPGHRCSARDSGQRQSDRSELHRPVRRHAWADRDRFSTTVERIQALNNLSDPRALRIGARLVIPPPL